MIKVKNSKDLEDKKQRLSPIDHKKLLHNVKDSTKFHSNMDPQKDLKANYEYTQNTIIELFSKKNHFCTPSFGLG